MSSTATAFAVTSSPRSWRVGAGSGPGVDYDDELVLLSCVLQDLGLSDKGNGDQRFEVDGADLAAWFLREHGAGEEVVDVVWDAVALHTSDGIAARKGPEVALTQAGIGLDIVGRGREGLVEKLNGYKTA